MKKLIKIIILLIVLVIVLVGGLIALGVSQIDSLVRRGIEAGGTYALGAPTTLQKADVGILRGTFAMEGLSVGNPKGEWKSPHFLSLAQGGVALNAQSLRGDVVELPKLALGGIDARLERRDGQSNYSVILDNLKKLSGDSGKAPPSTSGGGEKRFVVKELEIRDVKVTIDMVGSSSGVGAVVSDLAKVTIPIDSIVLRDIGTPGSQNAGLKQTGVTLNDLVSIVVQAVLGAAADKGGGVIPADVLGDLKGRLAGLDGLKDLKSEVHAKAQATIEEFGKKTEEEIKKRVEEAGKKVEDAVRRGLDKLLPGEKK